MRISLDTLEGMKDHDVPNGLIKTFLHAVLNTARWKDSPEVLADVALRFRRAVADEKRLVTTKAETPVS
jgi:hypothetical protein